MASVPWRIVPGGIVLRVRATPRARSDAVRGVTELAGGGARNEPDVALSVSTTAPPDGGAANAAIAATLARVLGVPKSAVRVAAGGTGRVKRVEVAADNVEALVARLRAACG